MTVTVARGAAGPTVLVADDDDAVRQSVADTLRLEGYQVTEAADGEGALHLLGTARFDAFVLDNHLSQCAELAGPTDPDDRPPAVLMAAHDIDATGRKNLAVQGVAYLRKPVDPEHLLDAVATAVGRSRQRASDAAARARAPA